MKLDFISTLRLLEKNGFSFGNGYGFTFSKRNNYIVVDTINSKLIESLRQLGFKRKNKTDKFYASFKKNI